MTTQQRQGPASGAVTSARRLLSLLVGIVETRLRLAVIELEEEKAHLIHLLLIVGLTLLCAAFGLMSLIVLIVWGLEPQYRVPALGGMTATLLLLALIGGVWSWQKAKRTTLLKATRKELEADRALLEDDTP